MFAPSISNMISKEYYDFLVGETNRGVTKLRAQKVLISQAHNYYRYHLISSY